MDYQLKVEFITKIYRDNDYDVDDFSTNKYPVDTIYDIFKNGIILDNYVETDGIIENYCGTYYKLNNNIKKSKEYYLTAIFKNNVDAMCNYADIMNDENNADQARKYYLMAIANNHVCAMNNYACFLDNENSWNNMVEAKKYYLMAIANNNQIAMINYANMLDVCEQNKPEAEKYYQMALTVDNANPDAYYDYAQMIEDTNLAKAIKLYWKYLQLRKKQGNPNIDNNTIYITNLLKEKGNTIIMDLLFENDNMQTENDKLKADIEDLRNFRKCVKELGPINSHINVYL